jgi:DNA repair protein RecN (Recombination protein N)
VSGGELSRVMLALKTLAQADSGPGEDAHLRRGRCRHRRARRDRGRPEAASLGDRFQVLCITHLPQIAACGRSHFLIEKKVQGRRTVTSVSRLDGEDRVIEMPG